MKKTAGQRTKAILLLLVQLALLFCYIRLFMWCYSFAYRTSIESGIEGVVHAVFGGWAA